MSFDPQGLYETHIGGLPIRVYAPANDHLTIVTDISTGHRGAEMMRVLAQVLAETVPKGIMLYHTPGDHFRIRFGVTKPSVKGPPDFSETHLSHLITLLSDATPKVERLTGYTDMLAPIHAGSFKSALEVAKGIGIKGCDPTDLAIEIYNFSVRHPLRPVLPLPSQGIQPRKLANLDHPAFPLAEQVALRFLTDKRLAITPMSKGILSAALVRFSLEANNPGVELH